MTHEDTTKVLMATYSTIESELGLLGDLPFELANTVANVYFRYFEMGVNSSPLLSIEQIARRQVERESIPKVISNYRVVKQKSTDQPFVNSEFIIDDMAECIIDVYSYQISDAPTKMLILRRIERKFRKTKDISDLVRGLQLYK